MVVNLARISPRFDDQGSKSGPTASSSFSLFFLPRSPVEALCDRAGASVAEAAANMERGSVPSIMELRGSGGTEEEDEEDEEVLPLRAPRRVFVSVTMMGLRGW